MDINTGSYTIRVQQAHGPDLEAIFRDILRAWMKDANRSPEHVARETEQPVAKIRGYLKGKPIPLDFASRICAISGLSLHDLLTGHKAYDESPSQVVSIKDAMLHRLGTMMSADDVRVLYDWMFLLNDHPEFAVAVKSSTNVAFLLAEENGIDTAAARETLRKMYDRIAAAATRREPLSDRG
jgi:hypothetical protein